MTFLFFLFNQKPRRVSFSIPETTMSFSATYRIVLSPFVPKYKEASNEKGRKTVLNNAVEAVKKGKALLEDAEDLPKDLTAVSVLLFCCHFAI